MLGVPLTAPANPPPAVADAPDVPTAIPVTGRPPSPRRATGPFQAGAATVQLAGPVAEPGDPPLPRRHLFPRTHYHTLPAPVGGKRRRDILSWRNILRRTATYARMRLPVRQTWPCRGANRTYGRTDTAPPYVSTRPLASYCDDGGNRLVNMALW